VDRCCAYRHSREENARSAGRAQPAPSRRRWSQPVVTARGSSGAHPPAMATLSANESAFPSGFEDADTRISAMIGLYGYYGERNNSAEPTLASGLRQRRRTARRVIAVDQKQASDRSAPRNRIRVLGARQLAIGLPRQDQRPLAAAYTRSDRLPPRRRLAGEHQDRDQRDSHGDVRAPQSRLPDPE
jgi:hypothetical protein